MASLELNAKNLYMLGMMLNESSIATIENRIKENVDPDVPHLTHLKYMVAGLMILDQQRIRNENKSDGEYLPLAQLGVLLGVANLGQDVSAARGVKEAFNLEKFVEPEKEEFEAFKKTYNVDKMIDLDHIDVASTDGKLDYTYEFVTFVSKDDVFSAENNAPPEDEVENEPSNPAK